MGDTTAVSVQTTDQSLQAGGKGRKGPGRKAGEAAGLAGREAPPTGSNCTTPPSSCTNPRFRCRSVLCHDDATRRASDGNTEDNCTPDTPLLPVGAGDLVPGAGAAGRGWCEGSQQGKVFWNGSQTVEHTASSQCIFWSVLAS